MTYLVLDNGRVISAHTSLYAARVAEPPGLGPSREAGPALARVPAWWCRNRPDDGAAEIGIVRTQATDLGVRFELRMCQAPAGTCAHRPCAHYAVWAVSRSYDLLGELASFVPSAWLWCGLRDDDPRGDSPAFRTEAQALIAQLATELRPVLRVVEEQPADTRTPRARRQAAQDLVVRFLARHFAPESEPPGVVRVRPVPDGRHLHLTLQPPADEVAALCGAQVPERLSDVGTRQDDVRQCDRCFGRAPIVPTPVLTVAEHDAWMDFLNAPSPPGP
ncbi:hypothetical protein ACFY1P_19825 [Streptomyces sp. NPDC001407]|uniref:hypothetical protein n=1 Tax=Streptomyces sp. NPDC001407 TaxID=3364573 RepID=UPI0036782796